VSDLEDQEGEEEGREGRVQAERVGIAESLARDDPGRSPADPAAVEDEACADEDAAVEAAVRAA
jgi:hypothetical protein